MSPEQARGKDIASTGGATCSVSASCSNEMLTGRRPFKGDTQLALLEQVANAEPRPPRQVDDNVPRELDRVCLKALSKRASDRYSTALDFAEDLRHCLEIPNLRRGLVPSALPFGGDSATPTPIARGPPPSGGTCFSVTPVPTNRRRCGCANCSKAGGCGLG